MAEMIACDALSYRYEQSPGPAVKDVSFTVDEGDYLCVVGENGSGKSTLLRMITGLAKPTSGSVVFKGSGRRELGYLPQQTPVQMDFPASVMEVVLTGRLNRKRFLTFTTKKDVRTAEANLEKLGVLDLKRRPYRELSGGQRQRVLLARALCASERLLVLDEPVTGLDPLAQEGMYRVISDLNRDGMTILMVSHDVAGAVRTAGKILHMDTEALYFGSAEGYRRSAPGRRFLSRAAADAGAPDADAPDSVPSGRFRHSPKGGPPDRFHYSPKEAPKGGGTLV
jgi:zinc transport system ATP-binding protein